MHVGFEALLATWRTLDSYSRIGGLPTDAAAWAGYSRSMTEKYVFADVDLPFHVWVKEGGRWVLRDAAAQLPGVGASLVQPGTSSPQDSPRSP